MGRKKNWEEVHTPVLNRYLLEGAFSQGMGQILMSLDECRIWEKTNMSLEDHVRALCVISRDELSTALMLVEGRHISTLVRKQGLWARRARTCLDRLLGYDLDNSDDLRSVMLDVTQWLQDAHLILHEDTPHETRLYLANKFLPDSVVAEELDDGELQAKSVVDLQ